MDDVTSCCRVYRNTIIEIKSRIALQNDASDGRRGSYIGKSSVRPYPSLHYMMVAGSEYCGMHCLLKLGLEFRGILCI